MVALNAIHFKVSYVSACWYVDDCAVRRFDARLTSLSVILRGTWLMDGLVVLTASDDVWIMEFENVEEDGKFRPCNVVSIERILVMS